MKTSHFKTPRTLAECSFELGSPIASMPDGSPIQKSGTFPWRAHELVIAIIGAAVLGAFLMRWI